MSEQPSLLFAEDRQPDAVVAEAWRLSAIALSYAGESRKCYGDPNHARQVADLLREILDPHGFHVACDGVEVWAHQ